MALALLQPEPGRLGRGPFAAASPRRAPVCAICSAPLRLGMGPVPGDAICGGAACRLVFSRRGQMDESAFRHYLQTQVRLRHGVAEMVRRQQALREADEREHEAVWAAAQAHLGAAADGALRLVVPSGPRRRAPLAQRRLERYRQHLQEVAAAAAATTATALPEQAPQDQPAAATPLEGRLCGLCGGGCCTMGGDRAYVTADTMRRVMRLHPQWSAADVVQAYLDRVAPRTERHSCINHGDGGCTLPRELRSDTCNDFACAALSTLQQQADGAARRQPVIVIRRRLGQWTRASHGADNRITAIALLTEEGARRLPLALAAAPAALRDEGGA